MGPQAQHQEAQDNHTGARALAFLEKALVFSFVILSVAWLASLALNPKLLPWIIFLFVTSVIHKGIGLCAAHRKAHPSLRALSETQAAAKGRAIASMVTSSLLEETGPIVQSFAIKANDPRDYMRTYIELIIFCLYLVQRRLGKQFKKKALPSFESALVATTYELISQRLKREDPNAERIFNALYSLRSKEYDDCQSRITNNELGALPKALYSHLRGYYKPVVEEDRLVSLLSSLGVSALNRAKQIGMEP